MGFWILEPEVAGGLGEGTIVDRQSHPITGRAGEIEEFVG